MPSSLHLGEGTAENAWQARRLFFRRFVSDPLRTGAQWPSGPALARAMAAPLDPALPGGVVELGPGTGVVTRALIARGFAPSRILALEIAPDFVAFLRRSLPGLAVRQASAFDLERELADLPFAEIQAVVSSLPLLTQPPARRRQLVRSALFAAPAAARQFVQYTYFLRPPVTGLGSEIAVERAAFVPWNLYPATVWRYRPA